MAYPPNTTSNYYNNQNYRYNPIYENYNLNEQDVDPNTATAPSTASKITAGIGAVGTVASGVQDVKSLEQTDVNQMFSPINPYGDPGSYQDPSNPFKKGRGFESAVTGIGEGVAAGSAFGPAGMAVGAIYGLGKGIVEGGMNKQKREEFEEKERQYKDRFFDAKNRYESNQAQQRQDLANQLSTQKRKASAYYTSPNSIYG